jgi:hypothetical protein
MNRPRTAVTTLALLLAALAGMQAAGAAETTLHGEGRYTATRTPFTLANGEQVVLMSNYGIASMASPGSEKAPELVQFRCGAMGLLSADDKFNFDVYCSMSPDEKDAIDFKGTGNSDLVNVTVIGGKGRWKGATGSGTITAKKKDSGASDAFSYELKIETP